MIKNNILDLEQKWDYSLNLLEEIYYDIKKMSEHKEPNSINKLDEINTKIDLARTKWINVDSLDKQVLDFRIILFNKDFDNIMEQIKNDEDKYLFDISKIETEYEKLSKEIEVDHNYLSNRMKELYNELERSKIKFMIRHIREWELNSSFTFDKIIEEISKAKQNGVDVSDIEEEIYE